MTPKEKPTNENKKLQTLDEICEHTRAIRRVTNKPMEFIRILEERWGTKNHVSLPIFNKTASKKEIIDSSKRI